jgi:hypothetical protein
MMMFGFYEKIPSLSLRLRVGRAQRRRKLNSNHLEYHSSLFDLIRMSSNNLEPRRDVAYG